MTISSKIQLKDYCLKALGNQFQQVNLSDENIENCIMDAFDYLFEFHGEFLEKKLLTTQVTSTNITNKSIILPDNVITVSRILPITKYNYSLIGGIMPNYNLSNVHSNGGYFGNNFSLADYEIAKSYLANIEDRLGVSTQNNFNRFTKRLDIFLEWGKDILEGEYIVAECYMILDQDVYTKMYANIHLRRYATALMKRQWGMNLTKFANVQTVGGVYLNAEKIFEDANKEIQILEKEIRDTYTNYLPFYIG